MSTANSSSSRGEAAALVDQLASKLRDQILSGELDIGSQLRQSTLAEQFEVSRTPIREALRKLESEGLVELIPHRGALVRGPTPREIREAYEVRAELEGLAAERAADWITEEQLRRLAEANRRFQDYASEASDMASEDIKHTRKWVEANDTFHEVIQEAARNDMLMQTIGGLHRAFPRNLTGIALGRDPRLVKQNAAEHARILDAIESRDGAAARSAMTDHVRRSGEIVAMWFERYTAGVQD